MKWLWKKLKTKKQKAFVIFLIITLVFALILTYLIKVVAPVIIATNEAYIKNLTVNALNSAVSSTIDENVYNNLITITKNNNGDVVLMQVNPQNVNLLNTSIILNAQNNLRLMGDAGFSVPLGTFSGISIFNGIGPKINIKMVPIGSVNCSFLSQFNSVGINQTHHKIYLNITASVCILLPITNKTITTMQQVLVAENIILGSVPETYLNTDNLTNALNLIPN